MISIYTDAVFRFATTSCENLFESHVFLEPPGCFSARGYSLVLDMHTFNDPKHNGTQSRLKTSLEKVAKKYDVQLGEGSDAWIASIAWIGDGAYRVG